MAAVKRLRAYRTGDVISVDEYRSLVADAMPEDDLLVAVQRELNLGHWRWNHIRRSDQAISQGDPGWPDIVAIRGPELIAVELKSAAGRYQPGQEGWLEAFAGVRHISAVTWRPADLDTLRRTLR